MPDGLFDDDLVLHWDEPTATARLTSFSSGAAGVVVVSLGGVSVELDAADFGRLSAIVVDDVTEPADLDRSVSTLGWLIGNERARAVRAELVASARRPQTIPGRRARFDDDVDQRQAREVVGIARLANGLHQAALPGLHPSERAVQVLEAAFIADRLGVLDQVDGLRSASRFAADVIQGLSYEELEELAELQGARDVVVRTVGLADLLGTSRRSGNSSRPGHTAGLWRPSRPEEADHEQLRRTFELARNAEIESPDSVNLLVGAPGLSVTRTTGDEHEAVLAGWADRSSGWWLRAFDEQGRVPIALAPFMSDGTGRSVARLLVAPAHAGRVEWDVVDDPDEHRSTLLVGRFVRAIAVGKRAAVLERLGEGSSAAAMWFECSEWHRLAGDEGRANDALARFGRTGQPNSQRFRGGKLPSAREQLVVLDRLVADMSA